jgi:CRISPR-associated protein Cas6
MYWQEEQADTPAPGEDIVDLSFRIECRTLPLDHASALSRALLRELPWLAEEPAFALHLVHVSEAGNGWQRPAGTDAVIHLSKRARLGLRLPRQRAADARALEGRTLDIDGHPMNIGRAQVKELTPLPTLQARYVVCNPDDDEETFVEEIAGELRARGIRVRKLLCGRTHLFRRPEGDLHLRSVMLADLSKEHSLMLQRAGIGKFQALGCGVFIPHKGIDAVAKPKTG